MRKLLLVYWGRKGINHLLSDVASALDQRMDVDYLLSVSRQNEEFAWIAARGARLLPVTTFSSTLGVLKLWQVSAIRRQLAKAIRDEGITDVLTLMPHVWSWAISGAVHDAGARYHTVIHDAVPHPGDGTARVLPLLLRDARHADTVFTLSGDVTRRLVGAAKVDAERIVELFHPVAGGGARRPLPAPLAGEPWRFLFVGRIMAYKGLPLFVNAMEQMLQSGRRIECSVMGEGPLGAEAERLRALGATVVNRWLSKQEFEKALATHHAVVLSHVEASQSGIAATTLGFGVPVIATPVGGLPEQISHDVTGLIATSPDVVGLSSMIAKLMDEEGLHARLLANIAGAREQRTPGAFVEAVLKALDRPRHGMPRTGGRPRT